MPVRATRRLAAALVLCILAVAPARATDPHIQLFSEVDRRVVAVGEALALRVELLATPRSPDAMRELEAAFTAAALADLPPTLEFVRAEAVRRSLHPVEEGRSVLVLSRRYILRARAEGALRVPAFTFTHGLRTYATPPHTVEGYRLAMELLDVERSVVPVVVETEGVRRGRRLMRTGSAFLARPDALVTSYHVVMGADRVRIQLPDGRRLVTREAWSVDPARDVVVLHVDAEAMAAAGVRPLPLAPPPDAPAYPVADADVAFTAGWPGGSQRSTVGVRYRDVALQPGEAAWISANPVRPGDSGGPLLDRRGRVLGVVSTGTVLYPTRDVLREEVCIASDPRPALWQALVAEAPRSLRALRDDPNLQSRAHARALQLAVRLSLARQSLSAPRLPDLDAQLDALAASIARTPGDAELRFRFGVLQQLVGTEAQAVQAYRAALDVHDGHFAAAYMLGRYHLRAGDYTEAARLFDHVRSYDPFVHLATYGLAQSVMAELRYEEAIVLLREVLRYDAHYAPALYDLARCYLALADEPRAQQLYVRLREVAPDWAGRLRQLLRYPVLQPVRLQERPRVTLALPETGARPPSGE